MTTRFFINGLMITSLTAITLLLTAGTAVAQTLAAEPQPAQSNAVKSKEKKASLSFEDELVEGGTQKPELFYLFQKKNFNYKRLIRLRENFLPEMRRTAEDVQRTRGGS